ncbi:MAG: ATP-binding protein [Candidatus Omnitrophica bacterium]|nr:ATP-binding protein [Candidatus Omnitrophota bacterium]
MVSKQNFVAVQFITHNLCYNIPVKNKEYLEKFKVLEKISSFISSIYNLHQLLNLIMEESKNILKEEASSLLLYDKEKKELFFEVATGKKGIGVKTIKLKLGQGIAGTCAREKRIINVKDVSKDKRFFSLADKKSHFKTKSILAVPLIGKKGKLLGVLEVLNRRDGKPFDKEDEELMKIIASYASLTIENAQLYLENVKNARMAGVGETILSLSHDIKNILNGLVGGVSLIDETMGTSSDEYVREGWNIVKVNVNRISELILDMLNYSSKKKPLLQEVNLNNFLMDVIKVYDEKAREKKIKVEFQLDEKIKDVKIDVNGMQRVILNFFTNACEAVPERTGLIKISTEMVDSMATYLIKISDNGVGIPPENLEKIFDIFFTTKGHKGTGLGLPVVKKIVSEHNGDIDIVSEQGKGTIFTLKLPVDPENVKKKK